MKTDANTLNATLELKSSKILNEYCINMKYALLQKCKELNIRKFINIFLALIIEKKNRKITSMDAKTHYLFFFLSLSQCYSSTIK